MPLSPMEEIKSAKHRSTAALKEIYREVERHTTDVDLMMISALRAARAAKVAAQHAHGSIDRRDSLEREAWRLVLLTLSDAKQAADLVCMALDGAFVKTDKGVNP